MSTKDSSPMRKIRELYYASGGDRKCFVTVGNYDYTMWLEQQLLAAQTKNKETEPSTSDNNESDEICPECGGTGSPCSSNVVVECGMCNGTGKLPHVS